MTTTVADVDIWGHVRFGLDILRDGLDHRDPYSFTSDRPWLNHEWLSEVLFALAWSVAGPFGLILLKLACVAAVLVLMAPAFRDARLPDATRAVLFGLLLGGILPRVSHVRPQLFSVVLFAALIRVFVAVQRGSRLAPMWWIPLLALWANFHGGWLVGLGTVTLWAAGDAWARRNEPGSFLPVGLCALGAGAASLANPYGVGLWAFLLETVRFGRLGIPEWGPAWTSPTGIVWAVFAILTVVSSKRMPWPRNPSTVLIPVFWGIASLRVGRLDTFFALSVLGLLPGAIGSLLSRRANQPVLPGRWAVAALAAAAAIVAALPAGRSALTCIGINASRYPEPEAIAYMRRHQLSGRTVTYFDWGEYGLWHMPPTMKISMDGRRETIYSDRTFAAHLELYSGSASGLEYLEQLNADFAWLPTNSPAARELPRLGWIPVFEGPQSTLFATAEARNRAQLPHVRVTEQPRQRCFPGP